MLAFAQVSSIPNEKLFFFSFFFKNSVLAHFSLVSAGFCNTLAPVWSLRKKPFQETEVFLQYLQGVENHQKKIVRNI